MEYQKHLFAFTGSFLEVLLKNISEIYPYYLNSDTKTVPT